MNTTYQIDNCNNLVIKRKRYNLTPSGIFKTTSDNRLVFYLNEPVSWRRKYDIPSRIAFFGRWNLDKDHNLVLDISQDKRFLGNKPLIFKGEILSVDSDRFGFMLKSYEQSKGIQRIQILELKGSWANDEYNRIIFLVEKKTSPDTLTFKNAWQINPQQQIVYKYERTELKTKAKSIATIDFDGFWHINSQYRLNYIISHGQSSQFDFRVELASSNLYPQEGVIKYRIGIGLKKENMHIISLYGSWKFSRKGMISFQMDYGNNRTRSIEFQTRLDLNIKKHITFGLYNKEGKPLGASIEFSRKFLRSLDAETFLRFKKYLIKKEKIIEAGINIPF